MIYLNRQLNPICISSKDSKDNKLLCRAYLLLFFYVWVYKQVYPLKSSFLCVFFKHENYINKTKKRK